jgi:hypothetical protein
MYTSPDGRTHNQIDHIFIDRRRQSKTLECPIFQRGCDTDHYLVVAKLGERLLSVGFCGWSSV